VPADNQIVKCSLDHEYALLSSTRVPARGNFIGGGGVISSGNFRLSGELRTQIAKLKSVGIMIF